jgi:hypothetical protein
MSFVAALVFIEIKNSRTFVLVGTGWMPAPQRIGLQPRQKNRNFNRCDLLLMRCPAAST